MRGLRDIAAGPTDAILDLNNRHAAETSWLDARGLDELLDGAFYGRQIGDADAFLIALDHGHPSYASPNYMWFRARYLSFVYVDRIVVAERARGRGHARQLYRDLIGQARKAGHDLLVCEVNLDPPNPGSDAFHAAMGFRHVGTAAIHGGAKTVRYLARPLGDETP